VSFIAILLLNVHIAEIISFHTVEQNSIDTKLQCNIDVLHKIKKQNRLVVLNQNVAVLIDFLQIQKRIFCSDCRLKNNKSDKNATAGSFQNISA
jgi:hypothetical protein